MTITSVSGLLVPSLSRRAPEMHWLLLVAELLSFSQGGLLQGLALSIGMTVPSWQFQVSGKAPSADLQSCP